MNYTDDEIVALIQSTNRKEYGFNVLVGMYQEKLYWVIRRMVVTHEDADDLLQNVFLKYSLLKLYFLILKQYLFYL